MFRHPTVHNKDCWTSKSVFWKKLSTNGKRTFQVDSPTSDPNFEDEKFVILKFDKKRDKLVFGFTKCKTIINNFPQPIRQITPLMAIQSKEYDLQTKTVCTIIGFEPNYALLNFLNITNDTHPITTITVNNLARSLVEIDPTKIPNVRTNMIAKHAIEKINPGSIP